MDPVTGTTSPRMRRQMLRQAVQENVYVKEGKRPPQPAVNPWPRRVALAGLVPALGLVALALVAMGRVPPALAALLPVRGEALGIDGVAAPQAANVDSVGSAASPAATLPVPPARLADHLDAEPGPIDGAVFPVGVRRIVLDPGHGGRDLGTVTAAGAAEKDLALDIARRLAILLRQKPGIEVLLTRDADSEVKLERRARFANEAQADLFVSIHLNWLQPASNRGVETFYLGTTQDPYLVELASRENRESGYALADVRRLLDGIYLDLRTQQSKELAASIQRSLHSTLERQNPALRDRGVKSAPFLVLVGTQMPAILAEVSCLSNDKEAELLATEGYRQTIAEALLEGLDSYTTNLSRPVATGG